jgi:hypothetical protein
MNIIDGNRRSFSQRRLIVALFLTHRIEQIAHAVTST